MNFLLSVTQSDYADKIINTKGFAETLGFGATMLLIGMATVFSVLCILWICLIGFKIGFHDLPEKRKNAASKVVDALPDEAVEDTPKEKPQDEPQDGGQEDQGGEDE